ncbi:transcription factor IIIB 90 kDa subunit-like [Quillaja saponaria]|uniref:Transcription factor IIIB 90 kDa subunit-like n=1 Tax=Quillaja saponaria TaxID=32244 RepID=A0AAD7VI16_QUISA|nr:transcription factor IIIB 90 kDa subunit-like [Quillaja saponaria]
MERQEKRSQEAKNSTPAQTAAEATRQILIKKRLSSKVNYDVLDKLFEEPASPENPKKIRTDSHDEKGHASKETNKFDEQVPEDEYADEGDGGDAEMYENAMFDENMDETYDYDDYDDYGNSGCDRF